MRYSLRTGFSFGLTTAIITTLGLMVGLNSGTHSKLAVFGGILTIAIADAFSDSLGIHISEESKKKSTREVWEATAATFSTKLVFALTFLFPVLLVELPLAIIINIVWGMFLLGVLSFKIARIRKSSPWKTITEHIAIALLVIFIAHYVGVWVALVFG